MPRRRPDGVYYATHNWLPAEIALLGTRSDADVAGLLGLHWGTVRYERQRRKIAPCNGEWTKDEIALLGLLPDRRLAAIIHRTPFAVTSARIDNGIAAYWSRNKAMRQALQRAMADGVSIDDLSLISRIPREELEDL